MPVPTFHQYAEDWWLRNEKQLAPSTQLDYRWRLETHLLPFFARHRLDEITFDQVERYIARKLDEAHPLSPRSINMTVTLLGAILEGAVERELIPRNPARVNAAPAWIALPAIGAATPADCCFHARLLDWMPVLARVISTSSDGR